eukprot:g15280.t1
MEATAMVLAAAIVVTVVGDFASAALEEAIKSVDLPPDPADALAESHADLTARRITALTTDDDTQPASPMASADRNLPPGDSGTDSARPSSSPAAAADAGAKEPTPDQDDRDDATTTPTHPATTDAAADGSTTPKAGSVFSAPAALSPHEANANDHAHAHAASLGEVSDDGDAHLTKLNGVVQSCDDLPAAFSRGVMTLVDDLICPRAKVVVISGDATIRSESDILTKDIFWVVQPGVSVTFEAPTVTLVRGSKMDRRPVLSVGAGGFVHFRVNERLPSSWENSLEQQHGFVVFLVDEGVRVRFHAPMVTSSQEKLFLSQAEDVPVLFIDCQALIRVSVHDWTPAVSEGIPEDKSGLVNTQEENFLESAVMRAGNCSDDAIAAAEPVDGGGSEEEEAIKSVDLPPDPADALAESHADLTARRITALTTDDDTQPASPMASADRNLPPGDSGTDSARPSSSPAAAADAGAKEPTPDQDDRDDATTTPTHPATTDAAADGSTTPKAGSVFSAPAALSPHEANANDHAHAHAASLGEVSDDGDAHLTKLNGVVQSCEDLPAAFSRGVMPLVALKLPQVLFAGSTALLAAPAVEAFRGAFAVDSVRATIISTFGVVSGGIFSDVGGFLSRTWDFFSTMDEIAEYMLWNESPSTGSLETRASMYSSHRVSSAMPLDTRFGDDGARQAISSPSFFDTGKACVPVHFAGVSHMLEAEMGQAALVMLRKAGDLIRVAREWDHVEGMMVCVAEEQPDGYFTYILRQMASSRFDAFSESLERLWEMASSSLGSVVRFCRLSSFLDMLDFARFDDIRDSTFADILERSMRRKGFADALLAGWVGLRWILVTADQRARDRRHFVRQYLKQRCPSKGYRLQRNETHIIAEVSRKLLYRKKGQRTTATLSLSRVLLLTPPSLESADFTTKIIADTIDRSTEFTFQVILGQLKFVDHIFGDCRRRSEVHLSKSIADTKASMLHEIHQQVRAAHNTVREECRAEMRKELAAATEVMRQEVRSEMRQKLDAAETAQREAAAMMKQIREERAADASRVEAASASLAEKEKRGQETVLQELSKLIADSESRIRREVEETIAQNRRPTRRGRRGGAGRRRAPKGDEAVEEGIEERQDEGEERAEDEGSLPPPS